MSDETESYIADDEEAAAVLKTVGKVIKMCRERKGLTQAELGRAVGYSEEQVSAVERGRRAPSEKFLKAADEVLGADGLIVGLRKDVAQAKYPKKVRDLANYEVQAVEVCAYANSVVHGLLQTPDYARALCEMRRPPFPEEEVDRIVAARLDRQEILGQQLTTVFSFVLEEEMLRRPLGGKMVMRKQLEHLLDVSQLRNVDLQVMPTDREDHAGTDGSFELLRLAKGDRVAHNEVQLISRLISLPAEVQLLEIRYGTIRSQALTPGESLAFIKNLLGET